jgi:hypothetical protein
MQTEMRNHKEDQMTIRTRVGLALLLALAPIGGQASAFCIPTQVSPGIGVFLSPPFKSDTALSGEQIRYWEGVLTTKLIAARDQVAKELNAGLPLTAPPGIAIGRFNGSFTPYFTVSKDKGEITGSIMLPMVTECRTLQPGGVLQTTITLGGSTVHIP